MRSLSRVVPRQVGVRNTLSFMRRGGTAAGCRHLNPVRAGGKGSSPIDPVSIRGAIPAESGLLIQNRDLSAADRTAVGVLHDTGDPAGDCLRVRGAHQEYETDSPRATRAPIWRRLPHERILSRQIGFDQGV